MNAVVQCNRTRVSRRRCTIYRVERSGKPGRRIRAADCYACRCRSRCCSDCRHWSRLVNMHRHRTNRRCIIRVVRCPIGDRSDAICGTGNIRRCASRSYCRTSIQRVADITDTASANIISTGNGYRDIDVIPASSIRCRRVTCRCYCWRNGLRIGCGKCIVGTDDSFTANLAGKVSQWLGATKNRTTNLRRRPARHRWRSRPARRRWPARPKQSS